MCPSHTDWDALAEEMGTPPDGGTPQARQALERILGRAFFDDAIEHYLDSGGRRELTRSVLMLLQAPYAMDRCYRILREDTDPKRRAAAAELLPSISGPRALPRVPALLADEDQSVQNAGLKLLGQLAFGPGADPAEVKALLPSLESHPGEGMRQMAVRLRQHIAGRERAERGRESERLQADDASPDLDALASGVRTREDLAEFVLALSKDFERSPHEWQNYPAGDYLESLSAWLEGVYEDYETPDGEPLPERPSWQAIAWVLLAAKDYE